MGKTISVTRDRYASRTSDIALENLAVVVAQAEKQGAVATWRNGGRAVRIERRLDKHLVQFADLALQFSDDGRDARRIAITMGFSGSTVTRGALVVDSRALDDAVSQIADAWAAVQRPDQTRRIAVAALLLARSLVDDGVARVNRFAPPPASLRDRLDVINEEAQEARLERESLGV